MVFGSGINTFASEFWNMQEQINAELDFQPYNSKRPDLVIPEYGRNIQKMVEYALTLEDREERNRCVRAILSVMGQLFPHLRDIEDYNHKLWDHLHIMAKFKLDVDSPYPTPDPEKLESRPDTLTYPQNEIKIGHYGHYVESFIDKCCALEEGPERQSFSISIANLMKQNALNWNRTTVPDDIILKDLAKLSGGRIKLEDPSVLSNIKVVPGNKFNEFESDTFSSGKKFKNNHLKKKKKFKHNK